MMYLQTLIGYERRMKTARTVRQHPSYVGSHLSAFFAKFHTLAQPNGSMFAK